MTLGRVLDPKQLDDASGPRGRIAVDVPSAWANAWLAIEVPRKLACARCDGGGCDGCGRSGALTLAEPPPERTVTVRAPASLGVGALVRVSNPFGEGAVPEILLVEMRPADAASPNVRRVSPPRLGGFGRGFPLGVAIAIAIVLLLVMLAAR